MGTAIQNLNDSELSTPYSDKFQEEQKEPEIRFYKNYEESPSYYAHFEKSEIVIYSNGHITVYRGITRKNPKGLIEITAEEFITIYDKCVNDFIERTDKLQDKINELLK